MYCPSCGFENAEGMAFCTECGARLRNQCVSCGFENTPQAKFCGKCGTSLTVEKRAKRRKGKTGKGRKDSAESGVRSPESRPILYTPRYLADRILAEQEAIEACGARDGERKTITALFADLKGSTALIEGLDPEEARAIIDPALQLFLDAVHRYEGYVAQALGDGIFALFGAPIAHEDHPQRALYAALRMQEEMRRYSDQLRLKGGTPLYLRVGRQ
jgi:class 3 adenylate cyclase